MNAIDLYNRLLGEITPIERAATREEDALRAVVELHEPVPCAPGSQIMDCRGCDAGAYAEDWPDAPCSTLLAVAHALGVKS